MVNDRVLTLSAFSVPSRFDRPTKVVGVCGRQGVGQLSAGINMYQNSQRRGDLDAEGSLKIPHPCSAEINASSYGNGNKRITGVLCPGRH